MSIALLLLSCASDRGYRFAGGYEAPRSGFRIDVVSRGYVTAGYDIANHAFARVQICPLIAGTGKRLRFSLIKRPQAEPLFESDEMLSAEAKWSEKLLGALLQSRGYDRLTAMELAGSYKVIYNALSGPKGVILQGQIDSVTVVQAKAAYESADVKNQPAQAWVRSAELVECDANP